MQVNAGSTAFRTKIPNSGDMDLHFRLAVLGAQSFVLHDATTPDKAGAIAGAAVGFLNFDRQHASLPNI
jgi:hypothetical protein